MGIFQILMLVLPVALHIASTIPAFSNYLKGY